MYQIQPSPKGCQSLITSTTCRRKRTACYRGEEPMHLSCPESSIAGALREKKSLRPLRPFVKKLTQPQTRKGRRTQFPHPSSFGLQPSAFRPFLTQPPRTQPTFVKKLTQFIRRDSIRTNSVPVLVPRTAEAVTVAVPRTAEDSVSTSDGRKSEELSRPFLYLVEWGRLRAGKKDRKHSKGAGSTISI